MRILGISLRTEEMLPPAVLSYAISRLGVVRLDTERSACTLAHPVLPYRPVPPYAAT